MITGLVQSQRRHSDASYLCPAQCIPGVDNQSAGLSHRLPIVRAVICDDRHAVSFVQRNIQGRLRFGPRTLQFYAFMAYDWHHGVMVRDLRSLCCQETDNLKGWRFPRVADVSLVGNTQNEDFRAS